MRGDFSEGRRWLESSLALPAVPHGPARLVALNGVAILAVNQGDYDRAEQWCVQAQQLAQRLNDARAG